MNIDGRGRCGKVGWAIAVILFLPEAAFANPITFPLLLISNTLLFVVANGIIGILEGCVIGLYNKIEIRPCCFWMTAANFCSAMLWAYGAELADPAAGMDWLQDGGLTYAFHWLVYFLAAVVLEAPFCWWLLQDEERPFRQTVKSALLAQACSYAAVMAWFALTGE